MNCWIFLMGIDANIMMMFLLWLFHWREGSGDHLDNCLHLFFSFFLLFYFLSFLVPLSLSLSMLGYFTLAHCINNVTIFRQGVNHLCISEIRISVWTFFEIEVFLLFISSSFMFKIGNRGQDDLTMLLIFLFFNAFKHCFRVFSRLIV
jgi:hypothetical protein